MIPAENGKFMFELYRAVNYLMLCGLVGMLELPALATLPLVVTLGFAWSWWCRRLERKVLERVDKQQESV